MQDMIFTLDVDFRKLCSQSLILTKNFLSFLGILLIKNIQKFSKIFGQKKNLSRGSGQFTYFSIYVPPLSYAVNWQGKKIKNN